MIGSVGFVYGSYTGVTEEITHDMASKIEADDIEVIEVCNADTKDFGRFDLLMLGLSTWYDGDLQSDWEDYFDTFKTIDFTNLIVLAQVVLENGGTIIGNWPSKDYDFSASKALKDEHTFYGLALDEDNEPQKSPGKIETWLTQVQQEYAALFEKI